VQEKVGLLDAELEGERARRESAEAHEKTLRAQISKEAKIQQELKGGRDSALAEVAELKEALQAQIAKQAETEQGRDRAFAEVADLKATVEGLTRARPDTEAHLIKERTRRWLIPGIVLIAAAVGGLLFSLLPTRKFNGEAENKVTELTTALGKSDTARSQAEAKLTELTTALGKSDKARKDAITELTTALGKSDTTNPSGAKVTDQTSATDFKSLTADEMLKYLVDGKRWENSRGSVQFSKSAIKVTATTDGWGNGTGRYDVNTVNNKIMMRATSGTVCNYDITMTDKNTMNLISWDNFNCPYGGAFTLRPQ
jgi:hypothetical protein